MANTIDFSSTSVGRFGTSCQVDSEEGISASELGMTDSELLQGSHQKRGRDACAKFSLSFWRVVKSWWKTAVIILTPVLFSPLPIVIRDPAANAAYVIFIIAVYWMTEALPLVVTSLLPLVLFPVLGVLSAKDVGVAFLNDTNWLFAGGLMVAIAVEKWDLHKRLALLVLLLMGSQPSMLLLGFMCSTGFLSMWLSNTATAAMMLPIAQAVLNEFEKCAEELSSSGGQVVAIGYRRLGNENGNEDGNRSGDRTLSELGDEELSEKKNTETSPEEPNKQISLTPVEQAASTGTETTSYNSTSRGVDDADLGSAKVSKNETVKRLGKGLMIGVAYASNIGGMATLTGTGPNLVLRGVVNE
jgi:sodium-dependent dicarboxylate transporter 2/3/5